MNKLTIAESAKLLGVSTSTIKLWMSEGLQSQKLGKKRYILDKDLHDFAALRTAKADSSTSLPSGVRYNNTIRIVRHPSNVSVAMLPAFRIRDKQR